MTSPNNAVGGPSRRDSPPLNAIVKADGWAGTRPTLDAERALWAAGRQVVAGVDEAGRGAWAGALVAAAVVLPPDPDARLVAALDGANDSKKMTAAARGRLFDVVRTRALGVGVGIVSALAIDVIGVGEANKLAWMQAIRALSVAPDYLLLDAFPLPGANIPYTAYIKGDARCLSIAAASIIAKVTRDRLLEELDVTHAGYGFGAHKGYGTAAHATALTAHGPCAVHRYSYAPVWAAYQKILGAE